MANESHILVRMRLMGAAAMARDAKSVERAFRELDKQQDRTGRSGTRMGRMSVMASAGLTRMQSGVSSVAGALGGLESAARRGITAVTTFGTAAAAIVGVTGSRYNAMQDQQRIAFTAMTGSATRAESILRRIKRLADESPSLDPGNVGQGISQMMAYGLTVDQAFEAVERIGDMAPVAMKSVTEAMGPASLAFGQIVSKGKLSAEELNQLAESVAVGRSSVAKELGLTGQEFEDAMRRGEISADDALEAIFKAMAARAGGASRMMAAATAGEKDRLMEALSSAAGEFTRPFYDAAGDAMGALAERMAGFNAGAIGERVFGALSSAGSVVAGLAGRIDWDAILGGAQRIMAWIAGAAPRVMSAIGSVVERLPEMVAGAVDVARQVIDAIRPAMPFVQNVLMPLLIGIGKGVLSSVVVAFKVLIPILKGTAKFLGWLGEKAKPLSPWIEKIGMAIGFIVSGPILKGIGALGKGFAVAGGLVGKAGSAISLAARVASIPIKVLGLYFRVWARAVGFVVGAVARLIPVISRAWTYAVRWVGFLTGLPGRIGRIAVNIVGSFAQGLRGFAGKLAGAWRAVVGSIASFARRVFDAAKSIGQNIVNGIVTFIKNSPGLIGAAIAAIVPGPIRDAIGMGSSNPTQEEVEAYRASPAGQQWERYRAGGGVVRPGEITRVGENGPELVRMPAGARVFSADDTRRMLHGTTRAIPAAGVAGRIVPIEITVNTYADGHLAHRQVHRTERALAERR